MRARRTLESRIGKLERELVQDAEVQVIFICYRGNDAGKVIAWRGLPPGGPFIERNLGEEDRDFRRRAQGVARRYHAERGLRGNVILYSENETKPYVEPIPEMMPAIVESADSTGSSPDQALASAAAPAPEVELRGQETPMLRGQTTPKRPSVRVMEITEWERSGPSRHWMA